MEAIVVILAGEVVRVGDARRGSIMLEVRIPSSEFKRVCALTKREVGTTERMTHCGNLCDYYWQKVTGVRRLDNLLRRQMHFHLIGKYEVLQMSVYANKYVCCQ
jgi:hypothetical protein